MTIEELQDALMNTKIPLFERYQVMFTLRNRGGAAAGLVNKVISINQFISVNIILTYYWNVAGSLHWFWR
jgi:hypothetical protein